MHIARRSLLAGVALGALGALGANANTPIHPSASVPAMADPEPLFAVPTRPDRIGRVLAPVRVNGQGPFRFMVDTGANRTTLTADLAARLGLGGGGGVARVVHGVTGPVEAPVVRLSALSVGAHTRTDVETPILDTSMTADADGILGMDGLAGLRLEVDFQRDRVAVTPSRRGVAPRGWFVLRGRLRFGQLFVTEARLRRRTLAAVIDTGAERSLANPALAEALRASREERPTRLVGAAPESVSASFIDIADLSLGPVDIHDLTVVAADAHVFRLWGLQDAPALLIGMDVLGQTEAMAIDFARAEMHLRFAGVKAMPIRNR